VAEGASSSVARRPGATSSVPEGDDQKTIGPGKRGTEGLDRAPVVLAVLLKFREVVVKGQVNHTIRPGRAAFQAFQVFEGTSMHFGADRGKRLL
jgi:hypothetical protein